MGSRVVSSRVGSGVRLILVAGCALVLGALAFSAPAQLLLLQHRALLSFAVIALPLAILLPGRWAVAAPLLAIAAIAALNRVDAIKHDATGLPITYLDVTTALAHPSPVVRAVGYQGAWWPIAVAAVLVGGVAIALAALAARRMTVRGAMIRMAGLAAAAMLASMAFVQAGNALSRSLAVLFPDLLNASWEAQAQIALRERMGPVEYLAFTRSAGDAAAAELANRTPSPLPTADIRESARRQLLTGERRAGPLPNIVLFHAESTFDPNQIFRLAKPVPMPGLWSATAETRALGPLRVNVIGGGSWVTEFEVLTGLDSRGFGYGGFYTHQTVGSRAKAGFPAYLRARGYRTDAYYTESRDFFAVGQAFARYGFDQFHDAADLQLGGGWSETDRMVAEQVVRLGGFRPTAQPRFLYVSSQQNHSPHGCRYFRRESDLIARFAAPSSLAVDCVLSEYLRRAASTAAAAELLLRGLKAMQAATGRPFVLLIYGDHQPYVFTEGRFSVAGGRAGTEAADDVSFARHRRGDNYRITFYHLLASAPDAIAKRSDAPIAASLIPTLLSAYVAEDLDRLYLPFNLLAQERCGADWLNRRCALSADLQSWGRAAVLK